MSSSLATTPATTTDVEDFDHCLRIACTLIKRHQPHGNFRCPDDEDGPSTPDKFIVELKPASEAGATITVRLYVPTLEEEFTAHLVAVLPPDSQVDRCIENGVLVLHAFFTYSG